MGERSAHFRAIGILSHPLILLVIGSAMVIGATLLGQRLAGFLPRDPGSPLTVFKGVLVAAGAVLAYKAFKRWVERTPDTEFAGPDAIGELLLGLLGGVLLICAATGVVALLGGYQVAGLGGLTGFWTMLSVAISSGAFEETLFRALGLRLLEKVFGTGLAVAAVSALFGAAHLLNTGTTLFSALAIAVEAGILLGAAYLLTRRLWLAIGIHSGWNFAEGWIFGGAVSGGPTQAGLLEARWSGPEWVTGGAFGLEASVPAVVVATLAGIAMLMLAYRRGAFVPPSWQHQTKL